MSIKKRILVVDDEPDHCIIVQRILEKEGFEVEVAYDGVECLQKVRANPPDAIILDVVMPGIDGIKLLQMARKSRRYAKIPVIFVSGHASKDDLDERQREIVDKANGYIEKPLKTRTFLETVKALLQK
jgi:two-component system alkaline phosphatase synthesis response regulator PhoP